MTQANGQGWLSAGDYLPIAIEDSTGKAHLYQRSGDGKPQNKITSGTTLSLTTGTRYTGEVLVGDDGSGGDRLSAALLGRHRRHQRRPLTASPSNR